MNPRWKINRSRYILEYYGTWDNAYNNAHIDPSTGIKTIILPSSVADKISRDPNCHPSKKPSWLGTFTSFQNYTL